MGQIILMMHIGLREIDILFSFFDLKNTQIPIKMYTKPVLITH